MIPWRQKYPYTDASQINLDWCLERIQAMQKEIDELKKHGGGGGTDDYTDLTNKPQINGVTLQGNKSTAALNIDADAVGAIESPSLSGASAGWYLRLTPGMQWAALPGANVNSVNGMTGTVVIGASDVGAVPEPVSVSSGDVLTWDGNDWVGTNLGTVFTVKGEVATVADLPPTGNTVGDVYYVSSVSAGYIWLETTDHPTGYWEELGEPIDLSAYIEKPTSPSAGDVLTYDSLSGDWDAAEPHYIPSGGTSGQVLKKSSGTDYDVAWANESGGGTERAWDLLATVDCSQTSGDVVLSSLDNFTEFMVFSDSVHNNSTTASGYRLNINNNELYVNFLAIAKTGTTQYQWSYVKYDGRFWHPEVHNVTTSNNNYAGSNAQVPYFFKDSVGKCTRFALTAPLATYQASAGTLYIWGR